MFRSGPVAPKALGRFDRTRQQRSTYRKITGQGSRDKITVPMENGLEASRMERLLGMGELVPLVGHKPSKQNISIDYIFSAGGEARKNRRTKRILSNPRE